MRIESQPATSTGLVPGRYRDQNAEPGTKKNPLVDTVNPSSSSVNHLQVPGLERVGGTHAHTRPHVTTLSEPGLPGTNPESPVQSGSQPGTSIPVPRLQPGTTDRLFSWLNYARIVLNTSPEVLPLLRDVPSVRIHARALLSAAQAGEDVDSLWDLVAPLDTLIERLKNRPVEIQDTRPTVGNARDRLKRDKAAPRTSAPTRQPKKETPMRATAASTEVKKPVRRQVVTADALADQMCREYEALEAARDAQDSFLGLAAHAITCLVPALHWVGGDPCTAQFPEAFQGERLAKTCAWLRGLTTAEQMEAGRAQMLTALWELWPAYVTECSDKPLSDEDQYKERTWDFMNRIDSLWVDPGQGGLKQVAPYLPEFRDTNCGRISYSFHLTLLALLTLNRQTGRALLAFEREAN